MQCKILRQPQIPSYKLTFHSHIIDYDQFEARDLDLSTQASAASFIKLRLDATPMLRPFVILRLVGNVIDSQFVYQELNPVVPKYLTLRDTIKDVCDKRVEYWVYLTMLYRVCHVCHGPKRGRGKFDEFKEHMRTHVFRQNEVFPVPHPQEWPTYKTVMSNYRNPWDMKQVKQSPFNPHWDNTNAKNPLAAPVYPPGIGGPGIGPVADQQCFQAQQIAAQALPPPILVPNPLPANYQLPAGYVILPGSPAPVPGQQWAVYHPPQQQNQGVSHLQAPQNDPIEIESSDEVEPGREVELSELEDNQEEDDRGEDDQEYVEYGDEEDQPLPRQLVRVEIPFYQP